jgi:hypothetical protein
MICPVWTWRWPDRVIWISDASAGAPSLPAWLPEPPSRPLAPWTREKGLQAVPPPQVALGGRRKRGDADCAVPMGHLFRTPQKRQRTAGGVEEAGS